LKVEVGEEEERMSEVELVEVRVVQMALAASTSVQVEEGEEEALRV